MPPEARRQYERLKGANPMAEVQGSVWPPNSRRGEAQRNIVKLLPRYEKIEIVFIGGHPVG